MVTVYLDLLRTRYRDRLENDAKGYMDFAIEGGSRARELVHDLLEFSRVDSQGKAFERVDMGQVMSRVIKNLSVQIGEDHASITCDDLPAIIADEGQMVQLMQNLVSNAIKFHGERAPRVQISFEDQGPMYLFSVKDNGIG